MKTNNSYDVIIVGAGPAGLTAAKILAVNHKKVLVLEKNETIGDKVCAGGLTLKDFKELAIPIFIIEEEFKYINLHIDNHLIKLGAERPWIWTCDRKELGKWQLVEAERGGAEVQLNSRVIEIQKDSLSVNDGSRFSFKYLIGADGSNSVVRKFLGLKTKNILVGMQYLVPKNKSNELEIFFDLSKFGFAYAWIFPHAEFNSVGVCASAQFVKSSELKQNFDDWCKAIDIDPTKYVFQSAPINYDYQGVEFSNIFLIGDAAGLASGLTGEGIYQAMISGREVAHKILNPNHDFKELEKMIKVKEFEESALTLYGFSKTITRAIFYFGLLLLRSKMMRKKLIKFLAEK